MTEDALADLLRFIRGEGRYALIGGVILTYPGATANHHAIYQGCRELECRGLLRRVWQKNHADGPVVLFRPLVELQDTDV